MSSEKTEEPACEPEPCNLSLNETTANSMSDGEIFDDDEPEEKVELPITPLLQKLPKNFRTASRSNMSDSESENDNAEDGGKGVSRKPNSARPPRDDGIFRRTPNSQMKNRFNPRNRFDRQNSNRIGGREMFPPRDRRDQRTPRAGNEKGDLRVRGINKPLFFPKESIKYTKTAPSISYAENPFKKHKQTEKSSQKSPNKSETEKSASSKKRNLSDSSPKPDSKDEEKEKVKKIKIKTPKEEKSPSKDTKPLKELKSPKDSKTPPRDLKTPSKDLKLLKEVKIPEKSETFSIKPEPQEKSSPSKKVDKALDQIKKKSEEVSETSKKSLTPPRVKLEEKLKLEINGSLSPPEKKKKISKNSLVDSNLTQSQSKKQKEKIQDKKPVEKPKVNIFLEDSDEVDEFEKAESHVVEVRSRWSTPPPIKKEIVESDEEFGSNLKSTVVDDLPPSPVPLSENIFDTSSIRNGDESKPKSSLKVKNVCSFLSDIANGSFELPKGNESPVIDMDSLDLGYYTSVIEKSSPKIPDFSKTDLVEADTSTDKAIGSDMSDSSSSSDDSDSSSSSDSEFSSSDSEESEDSDEDIPITFTRGFGTFGKFDRTMPLVGNARSNLLPSPAKPLSLFKPPGLEAKTLVPLKTIQPTPVITPLPPLSVGMGALPFPIPFKIYSLKDTTNAGMIFPNPVQLPTTPISTPHDKKETTNEKNDKRSKETDDSKDRKRSRLDDKRKTPPRSLPSPEKRKHADDRSRKIDDRKTSRKREPSPRHSHGSRESRRSPLRRHRRSRSRSRTPPPKTKSSSSNSRAPHRSRLSPAKPRSPPPRRSISRSPPNKRRRSSSPRSYKAHPYSPHRRSPPRRRGSRSPKGHHHRPSSPISNYRRHSISPGCDRDRGSSPANFGPDSTISDSELEKANLKNEFYHSSWDGSQTASPRRPALDDRIHRILSGSPTNKEDLSNYHDGHYENNADCYYPEMYHHNHDLHNSSGYLNDPRFPSYFPNFEEQYNGFDSFIAPRNYVNNSNLVEVHNHDRRSSLSNQVAVQVGNVLEIVPAKVLPHQELLKEVKCETVTPMKEILNDPEKIKQAKVRRKLNRERHRLAKHARKEKLRQEIQRYLENGIKPDNSDDENLVPLRQVQITASAGKSIIKKEKSKGSQRKVLFSDGILPGESTSEEDVEEEKPLKQKRMRHRRKRLIQMVKTQISKTQADDELPVNTPEFDQDQPPSAPCDSPPLHLKQPILKQVTSEMYAAFPINPEPMYYYYQKYQQSNGYRENMIIQSSNRSHSYNDSQSHLPKNASNETRTASSFDPRLNSIRTSGKIAS